MTDKNDKKQNKREGHKTVAQSILWAAALIGSSLLLRGTEQSENVFFLLLILATMSVLMAGGGIRADRCLWRKLTGRGNNAPEA